jgi:hypothetical protein
MGAFNTGFHTVSLHHPTSMVTVPRPASSSRIRTDSSFAVRPVKDLCTGGGT